jgi:glycerol-3-phosphate dehydrogenase
MRATLEGRIFDLLVIGGGITGAGVARDAAMRGLEVALVEKDDFASGTSSRSSRLVHGGIRYLEHGQIRMVRESVREREILLRIAPHLVKPIEFTWPVYRGARISRTKLRAALSVYNMLAGHYWLPRMYSAERIGEREPLLQRRELKGGASYTDAITDDSRLTLANILSAQEHHAVTLNHTEALRPISRDRDGWLVKVRDGPSEIVSEVRTRVLVNATGPWRLNLERRWPQHRHVLRGSKGVHIALPKDRIGNNGAVTMMSPDDGRVMFVLPSGPVTMVGTTDTWTSESPDEVRASAADTEYLLNAAAAYFPDAHLTDADIVSAWAGIRPLADWEPDRKPSDVSREHRITQNGAGMMTVSGGKLTTYRAMAQQIVNQVELELGKKSSPCKTADVELPGKDRAERVAAMAAANPGCAERLVPELSYTVGDLVYAIENEMALTLSDLLMRRTRLAFELADHGVKALPRIVDAIAASARWSDYAKRAQIEAYVGEVARVFGAGNRSHW